MKLFTLLLFLASLSIVQSQNSWTENHKAVIHHFGDETKKDLKKEYKKSGKWMKKYYVDEISLTDNKTKKIELKIRPFFIDATEYTSDHNRMSNSSYYTFENHFRINTEGQKPSANGIDQSRNTVFANYMHEDYYSSDILPGIGIDPYDSRTNAIGMYVQVDTKKWPVIRSSGQMPGMCPMFLFSNKDENDNHNMYTTAFGKTLSNLILYDTELMEEQLRIFSKDYAEKINADDFVEYKKHKIKFKYNNLDCKKRALIDKSIVEQSSNDLRANSDFLTLPGRHVKGLLKLTKPKGQMKSIRNTSGAYSVLHESKVYIPVNVPFKKSKKNWKEPAIWIAQTNESGKKWNREELHAIRLNNYSETLGAKLNAIGFDFDQNLWFTLGNGIVGVFEKEELEDLTSKNSLNYTIYDLNKDDLTSFPDMNEFVQAYGEKLLPMNLTSREIEDNFFLQKIREYNPNAFQRGSQIPSSRRPSNWNKLKDIPSLRIALNNALQDSVEYKKLDWFKDFILGYNRVLSGHQSKFDSESYTYIDSYQDLDFKKGNTDAFVQEIKKEKIQNSFSVGEDGIYIVSNFALYKFQLDTSQIVVAPEWTANNKYDSNWDSYNTYNNDVKNDETGKYMQSLVYNNFHLTKSGHLSRGSGTTPTLFDYKDTTYIAITDNDYPSINLLIYNTVTGENKGQYYAFRELGSACENSVLAIKHKPTNNETFSALIGQEIDTNPIQHLIVANTFGLTNGFKKSENTTVGGMQKYEFSPQGKSISEKVKNTHFGMFPNNYDVKIATPKMDSRGIIYLYNRQESGGKDGYFNWQFTAVDGIYGTPLFSLVPRTEISSINLKNNVIKYSKFNKQSVLDRKVLGKGQTKHQAAFNNMMSTFTLAPNGGFVISAIKGFMYFPDNPKN